MKSTYLSCADIVSLTGMTKKTVWSWCRSGKLKASRPGGRDYVIKREDFEAFMNRDNRKSAASGN